MAVKKMRKRNRNTERKGKENDQKRWKLQKNLKTRDSFKQR